MTRVLERGGFHVVQAASVGEALRALDPPPDLILLDIGLGTESGLDVVRAVRADAATSGLTVVALSAYGMPEDIARALEAGCDAYLVKPVEGRALLGRVREFLDTREVRVPESVEAP